MCICSPYKIYSSLPAASFLLHKKLFKLKVLIIYFSWKIVKQNYRHFFVQSHSHCVHASDMVFVIFQSY